MFHAKGSELRITSTRLPTFICTSPWCLCKDTCLSLIQTLQFYKSHRTLFSARSYMHHMGCEAGYRFSQCISAKELCPYPNSAPSLGYTFDSPPWQGEEAPSPSPFRNEGQSLNHLGLCKGTWFISATLFWEHLRNQSQELDYFCVIHSSLIFLNLLWFPDPHLAVYT